MASLTTERARSFFEMSCIITGLFPQKNPCSVARQKAFFCAAILPSTMATYCPAGRGSSRPSTQLLPRRVAVAAAAAAHWAPGARAPRHTEGSVKTVSHPHAVKEVVLMHFNGEFCRFLAKQLENNSVGISTSVVTVCDQNRGSWSSQGFDICTDRRPCPSSFPLHNVYIQSLGILYIKCNMVNEPEVTHKKPVEKLSHVQSGFSICMCFRSNFQEISLHNY